MNMKGKNNSKNVEVAYPELSYKINGVVFNVFKEIGSGHLEKYYQKAVAIELKKQGINFVEQRYVPVVYQGKSIGKYYLDFLVEDKIVLELKKGIFIPANLIQQTKKYLMALNLKLAIIACFTNKGVIIKRILNLY